MENFKMEEPGHGQMKNLDRGKQLETTILGKKIEQLLTNKSQFISKINHDCVLKCFDSREILLISELCLKWQESRRLVKWILNCSAIRCSVSSLSRIHLILLHLSKFLLLAVIWSLNFSDLSTLQLEELCLRPMKVYFHLQSIIPSVFNLKGI